VDLSAEEEVAPLPGSGIERHDGDVADSGTSS
jgi:hypothetical protein